MQMHERLSGSGALILAAAQVLPGAPRAVVTGIDLLDAHGGHQSGQWAGRADGREDQVRLGGRGPVTGADERREFASEIVAPHGGRHAECLAPAQEGEEQR